MPSQPLSDEECIAVARFAADHPGLSITGMARRYYPEITQDAARNRFRDRLAESERRGLLTGREGQPPRYHAPQGPPAPPSLRDTLLAAQMAPPVPAEHPTPNAELEELRRMVARLQEQITWAQHAHSPARTGGKLTLNRSDDHFTDRAHTIRCHREMWQKSLLVLRQYQPRVIEVVCNGDAVAGRGIYRNQEMDSLLQTGDEQLKVAAIKIAEECEELRREFPDAEITLRVLTGNHDRAMGEPLAPALVLRLRALGVPAVYHGDVCILNLASSGTYNVLFEHGYGYSRISPSSPAWLATMQEKIINLYRRGYHGEKRIRRISHGHTHFFTLGIERIRDLFFDTTGGCQRNDRTSLGKNQRPQGWIIYASPEGFDGILDPIGVQPDAATQDAEHEDQYLQQRNAIDCMECLRRYDERLSELGITELTEVEGR
jgi:hypothetical protein